MNSQMKQTPWQSCDCETVQLLPANAVSQTPCSRAPGGIVAANDAFAERLQLRPGRLGAAGMVLVSGFGAFSLPYIASTLLANRSVSPGVTIVDLLPYLLIIGVTVGAVFAVRRTNKARRPRLATQQIAQYRLIGLLGSGGMGEVYLAEHRLLQRPCAIKLIRPERSGDAQILARFEREVRMTARLSHWNTVEIFDYGRTDDGTFYYVMEYLPGMSLEELVQAHGPQPAERVVHLLRQACEALREAHSIGLIHRDIKPANLFAAQRGGIFDVVKLLDFGLAKPVAEVPCARLTQEGALSGTPLFMSPEQANGLDDIDGRSDIYSLGAVAYMLLTGRPPFERNCALEVLIAHARDEVTPPSELSPDVPADLERIVLRCLAKQPEDRYQDMGGLEQAFARCAAADRWTQSCAARWWEENAQGSPPSNRLEGLLGGLQQAC